MRVVCIMMLIAIAVTFGQAQRVYEICAFGCQFRTINDFITAAEGVNSHIIAGSVVRICGGGMFRGSEQVITRPFIWESADECSTTSNTVDSSSSSSSSSSLSSASSETSVDDRSSTSSESTKSSFSGTSSSSSMRANKKQSSSMKRKTMLENRLHVANLRQASGMPQLNELPSGTYIVPAAVTIPAASSTVSPSTRLHFYEDPGPDFGTQTFAFVGLRLGPGSDGTVIRKLHFLCDNDNVLPSVAIFSSYLGVDPNADSEVADNVEVHTNWFDGCHTSLLINGGSYWKVHDNYFFADSGAQSFCNSDVPDEVSDARIEFEPAAIMLLTTLPQLTSHTDLDTFTYGSIYPKAQFNEFHNNVIDLIPNDGCEDPLGWTVYELSDVDIYFDDTRVSTAVIRFNSFTHNTVRGFDETDMNGIDIVDDYPFPIFTYHISDNVISHNLFVETAIVIGGAGRTFIESNTFQADDDEAIYLAIGFGIEIRNNTMSVRDDDDVVFNFLAVNTVFDGNRFSGPVCALSLSDNAIPTTYYMDNNINNAPVEVTDLFCGFSASIEWSVISTPLEWPLSFRFNQ